MKIYSFDGKKKPMDNIDLFESPLFLGQRFKSNENGEKPKENNETNEKQIENN